ncbi:MAG: ribonuclease H-like domain-containing protein [Deltaproteobacteria bacterium]
MNLKGKLAGLRSAGPGTQPAHATPPVPPAPTDVHPPANDGSPAEGVSSITPERAAHIGELRGRIHAMMARSSAARAPVVVPPEASLSALPFTITAHEGGSLYARIRTYPVTQRHGHVPLHAALDVRGDAIATLALDPKLASFDPATALYIDTETTGLSGGTGTLAFLVGLAWFEGRCLHVEQLFLAEPSDEPAMLSHLARRIERAGALVSYNGKAFDLPLLRSRFVMARVKAPKEPAHLDLVHASRRIYGERLEQCRLTNLERDVLGFVRIDDVPGSEIPARYATFLRTGDASGLFAVVEHNLWDVIAMAALVGELGARIVGGDASGRFEPSDMTGLARTAFRAGARTLAMALAEDAAVLGRKKGEHGVAARASMLAAKLHRRSGDHLGTHRRLLDALTSTPDDAGLHLALAKLYEHGLRDPTRALEHARRAREEEDPDAHARRLARLLARIKRTPIPLPGV